MTLAIGDLGWRLYEAHWKFDAPGDPGRLILEYGFFRKISGGRFEKAMSGQTVHVAHENLQNGWPAVAEVRDAEDKIVTAAQPAIAAPSMAAGKTGFRSVFQWLLDNQADSRVPRITIHEEALEEV